MIGSTVSTFANTNPGGISGEKGGQHRGHEKENIHYVISERQATP